MFVPEGEKNALLDLIAEKMRIANRSLGDQRDEVEGEAKKVLQRILQSCETRDDLSEKLVKVIRNLESVTPESKAAWFSARASLLKRKLDTGGFDESPDVKKAATALLKEKNANKIKNKAKEIGTVQAFVKASKPKDSALVSECSEMLLNLLRLPAGSVEQGQLVSALIGRLRQVPIDKHMWDTIVSAYDGTTGSMQLTIKMISTALAAHLGAASELSSSSIFEGGKLTDAIVRCLEKSLNNSTVASASLVASC